MTTIPEDLPLEFIVIDALEDVDDADSFFGHVFLMFLCNFLTRLNFRPNGVWCGQLQKKQRWSCQAVNC